MTNSILKDLNRLDVQIYRSIAAHPGLSSLSDVELHTSDKHIRLRGRAGSFFEKQLVQETVRCLDQQRNIENDIQVTWK